MYSLLKLHKINELLVGGVHISLSPCDIPNSFELILMKISTGGLCPKVVVLGKFNFGFVYPSVTPTLR
jgi:hypothetical protein